STSRSRTGIAPLGVRAPAPVVETGSVSPATFTRPRSRTPHHLLGRTTTNASDVRTRTWAARRLPSRGATTCAETTSPTLPSTKITRRRDEPSLNPPGVFGGSIFWKDRDDDTTCTELFAGVP